MRQLQEAELRAYATGYLDAIADYQPEIDRLNTLTTRLEALLQAETDAANRYYHDAYCTTCWDAKRTHRNRG
jgi:hypothetical protein